MILTGHAIVNAYRDGLIHIDPFDERHVNPNSYDFRLGSMLKTYVDDVLDCRRQNPTVETWIPEDGLVLEPGRIYLGHTVEVMGSEHFVPIVRGKSSTARLGLFIHVTADLIDIGSINQWTLQLHAVQPVRVYPGMRIGQVTFWRTVGKIELYRGKYQGSMGPMESMGYIDFEAKPSPVGVG